MTSRKQFPTYQEDDRNIEKEGDTGVGEESEATDAVDVAHCEDGQLSEDQNEGVHDGAGRSVVVERNKGVHLELLGAQNALNHDQTGGLEDDTSDLEEEANHDELELAERGNDDTEHDEGDVAENLEVHGRNAHAPSCEQDGDGSRGLFKLACGSSVTALVRTHLEHLDEGDTEVQVCLVTADQTQTEEETNGHNGAQVDFAGHGHFLSRVEDGGEAGEDLGHDGREDQMPCREEDGEVWQRLLARACNCLQRWVAATYGIWRCRGCTC